MISAKEKHFYNVGINYKKADVALRSKFSISKENQVALLKEAIASNFEGVCVISTCNRTEIFGFAEHPYQLIHLICNYSKGTVEEFSNVASIYKNNDAIMHLFRIGTGIESQILGDYEIVSQLKQAFKISKKHKLTNAYTERLFNAVLQASKEVKNQTELSSGITSVSYAAIQYVQENIAQSEKKSILVYGLGKMGKHTCLNLVKYTATNTIKLVNRTDEKAVDFTQKYSQIQQVPHKNLSDALATTDILIVATGASKPTITKANLAANKPMVILDLSIPENVDKDVLEHTDVTLVNVDELSKITLKTLEIREKEVPKAEEIIDIHFKEFKNWLHQRKYADAISELKTSLKSIQQNEIAFHKKKIKNFDEQQAEIITSRIIQKITTQFVKHLKNDDDFADKSVEVMKKVFQE